MADRTLLYRVRLEIAQALAQAERLKQAVQESAAQPSAAEPVRSTAAIDAERQITQATRSEIDARLTAARAEAQERTQIAQATVRQLAEAQRRQLSPTSAPFAPRQEQSRIAQLIEQERQLTQTVQSETQQRTQARQAEAAAAQQIARTAAQEQRRSTFVSPEAPIEQGRLAQAQAQERQITEIARIEAQERARLALEASGRFVNAEEVVTTGLRAAIRERLQLEQQATAERTREVQRRAQTEQQAIRETARAAQQLSSATRDAIPFGKAGGQGLQVVDLDAVQRARRATQDLATSERQLTGVARTEAQIRLAAARAEAKEREQAARAAAQKAIEEERRITAQTKAEIAQRQREQRQQAGGGGLGDGLGGGLGGALVGGLAGYLSIQGAREIARQAQEFAELGNQVRRTEAGFRQLSGSASQAERNIHAIQEASGGTVTRLKAMEIGIQATGIGLATTAKEFEELTKASRAIALLSPQINDVGDAMTQLALFSANVSSFARADQLLVNKSEVQAVMKEIQAANAGIDDSQAKLLATVQLVNEKFGDTLTQLDKQSNGVLRFKNAIEEARAEAAKGPIGVAINVAFGQAADTIETATVLFGGGGPEDVQRELQKNIEFASRDVATPFHQSLVPGLKAAEEQFAKLNKAVADGVPGAEAYQQEAEKIVRTINAQWGPVTDEQIQALRELNAALFNSQIAAEDFGQAPPSPNVQAEIDRIQESRAALQEFQDAVVQIEDLFARADAAIAANIPGADQYANKVNALATDIANTGTVTEDHIAALQELEAWYGFAGTAAELNASSTQAAAGASDEWAAANLNAAGAADETATATDGAADAANNFAAATGAGAAGAGALSGAIGPLPQQLDDVTISADDAAAALERFRLAQQAAQRQEVQTITQQQQQALLGQAKSVISIVGTDEAAALFEQFSTGIEERVRELQALRESGEISKAQFDIQLAGLQEGLAEPFEQIKEAEKERERAAKEAESAAKRGAREMESAWKQAAKDVQNEFKKAAAAAESELRKVPGLFGRSSVTQEQLDLAKLGVGQNFADDWLRRLEDEVINKVEWPDVSIEEARAALQRVGIDVTGNMEADVKLFAQAWENSSLFADKENLKFINEGAIQAEKDLQEKIKQGQQNIIDAFGVTVETLTGKLSDEEIDQLVEARFQEILAEKGGAGQPTGRAAVVPPESDFEALVAQAIAKALAPTAGIEPVPVDAPESIAVDAPESIAVDAPESIPVEVPDVPTEIRVVAPAGLFRPEANLLGTAPAFQAPEATTGRLAITELNIPDELKTITGGTLSIAELIVASGAVDAFFAGLGDQFQGRTDGFEAQGGAVASLHDEGYISHERADLAGDMFSDLGDQFQGRLEGFLGQGDAVAGLHELGYQGHEWGDMAGVMASAISAQFAANRDAWLGLGDDAGALLAQGMTGHDYAGATSEVIALIRSGLLNEGSRSAMLDTGDTLMSIVEEGMTRRVGQPGWGRALTDLMLAALQSDMADALEGT